MIPVIMNDAVFHAAAYNEGWNIYHAMRVARGEPLYDDDLRRIVNYPYLSFYVIGWLGLLTGAPLAAARVLSGAGFVVAVIGCGICARALGGSRQAAMLAALLFAGFSAITMQQWVGTADPQFPAMALSVVALALHLRATHRATRIVAVPLCLMLSLFTKHQELSIPAAIFVDMAVNHRKDLPAWLVATVALAVLFTAVGFLASDAFLTRLLSPRRLHIYHGIRVTSRLLEFVQVPLTLGMLWMILGCPRRHSALLWTLGGAAFLLLAVAGMGQGVSQNIGLDFLFWVSLTAGLAVAASQRFLPGGMTVCAVLVLAAGFEVELKAFLAAGRERQVWAEATQSEHDFRAGIAFVAGRQGDAICDNLLLCYYAGKPMLLDQFNAGQMVALGRLPETAITQPIERRMIATVQLTGPLREEGMSVRVAGDESERRFSPGFLRAVFENYRLDHVSGAGAFYVPKG